MPIDWERISNSIKHDATIRYVYIDLDDHCVLGGLARDYGVDLPKSLANSSTIQSSGKFSAELSRATGLTYRQLGFMQRLNDKYATIAARRRALLAWVAGERLKGFGWNSPPTFGTEGTFGAKPAKAKGGGP